MENLIQKTRATAQDQKKRKRLIYGLGAILLLVVAGYFVRQFNLLYQRDINGIVPPSRAERLDTTKGKETTITRLYELEEKNRHRDSITQLEENKALNYIVMDWKNLYDVRKKESSQAQDAALTADSASSSPLQILLADSLRHAGTLRKSHLQRSNVAKTRLSRRPTLPNRGYYSNGSYGKLAAASAPRRRFGEDKLQPNERGDTDPFNTGRASGLQAAEVTQVGRKGRGSRNTPSPNYTSTASSVTHAAGPASSRLVVQAVVHGDYKVQNGAKVTFRTLQGLAMEGMQLPANTLITGLAQLSNGRITFSDFRAKLDGSSIVLPFSCYDSDMMAGISYGDQGSIETEVRRSATSAIADAASALSNAIPHSALARASGNLARGALRGAGRKRESFIYLSDGYKVFMELQPPQ